MTEVASLRILVVDNQPECDDVVSLFLREGNEVRTVFGGLFPMGEAREFAPELVMVHVGRPEFDALGLVKRFRRRNSFGTVPLVAMTIECDPESRKAGIAAGFDAWLVKPIGRDTLAAVLSDAREVISMPAGLAQQTIEQVILFDKLQLEQDDRRRIDRLERSE